MDREVVAARDPGQRRQLVRRVDLAHLGRLGEAEAGRLGPVHLARAGGSERGLQRRGLDLAEAFVHARHLGAAGHELGRAAFVVLDMGGTGRIDHAPGRGEGGERERVCRSPGHRREDPYRGLEQGRERRLQALGPGVAAIGRGAGARRLDHGVDDLGRGRGHVVAAKIHRFPVLSRPMAPAPAPPRRDRARAAGRPCRRPPAARPWSCRPCPRPRPRRRR